MIITIRPVDHANPYDIPAMNAASLAVGIAGLPFDGPVGAVRLGLIGGEWVVNPTFQELDEPRSTSWSPARRTTKAASTS